MNKKPLTFDDIKNYYDYHIGKSNSKKLIEDLMKDFYIPEEPPKPFRPIPGKWHKMRNGLRAYVFEMPKDYKNSVAQIKPLIGFLINEKGKTVPGSWTESGFEYVENVYAHYDIVSVDE